jgi:hypothetical protein
MQRVIVTSVHIRAVLEEDLHNSCVAATRCPPQRGIVNSVHVSAVLEEELHNLCLRILRCRCYILI